MVYLVEQGSGSRVQGGRCGGVRFSASPFMREAIVVEQGSGSRVQGSEEEVGVGSGSAHLPGNHGGLRVVD